MELYEQPRSPLTKSGQRRQMSEEMLHRRRERDRQWRASESAEERELHCSLRRQRDSDRHLFLDTLFPLYVHSHHGLSKIIHTPKLYTHPQYSLLISYVLAQACPTMIYIH